MARSRSVVGPLLLLALVVGPAGCDSGGDSEAPVVAARSGRFSLHPYLGYTYAADAEGINAHGFEAGGREYPYQRAADEFVVGVFGGTAAGQVARHEAQIAEALLPAVQAKGYTRITVLPFAVEGWRQPQTFHAFVKYLPDIDMAIVVDGLSEVVEFGDASVAGWPADYPAAKIYGPLSGTREGGAQGTPAARAAEYFAAWEDRIRLMDLIGLERSKPVLHFIEPNPFGSVTTDADADRLAALAGAAYVEMRKMTERLAQDGVSSNLVEDLLSSDAPGTSTYDEDRRALTADGAKVVAETVAEEVEMSEQIDEVIPAQHRALPTPEERRSGLSLPLLGSAQ